MVTDFEGEPARPLAERRRPASPLRDVAGMLRSLDYAARTSATAAARLRRGCLAGSGAVSVPDRVRRAGTIASLLRAFELEKACYEVRYEANFRPDWIWLPLGAIERMVA